MNSIKLTLAAASLGLWGLSAEASPAPLTGTKDKVTYQGRSVTVTINDRGNFRDPVCLDLTYGAFTQIADTNLGNIGVQYEVL